MRRYRRRHDDGVERVVCEELAEVGRRPCLRKPPAGPLDRLFVRVADPRELRERVEVSGEVRAPIAEARYCDSQSFQTLSDLRPASPVALRKSTTSCALSTTPS